ncbi:MAG: KGG domain-containing protein [Beijerinckiaceae bacterium]|nr:KGG domain-containing protein [Beijerinckiaceae bacterium]
MSEEKTKSKRGFASMSPEKRREIARKGGASIPPEKRSFSQDRSLAAAAGKKGGSAVPGENRSFSTEAGLASKAGRKGGAAKHPMRSTKPQG